MRVFLRGGNWNNGSNAGAFALNLNWSGTTSNNNVGFRCARYLPHKFVRRRGLRAWPE